MAYQPPSPSFKESQGSTIASILHKKSRKSISIFLFGGIKELISRLRIHQKISYGYGLAIGIGVLGTAVGLKAGSYYETQAQKQLNYATEKYNLLSDLRYTVLEAQFHQQRLVPVIGNSVWLKYEIFQFNKSIKTTKKLLHESEILVNNSQVLPEINQDFQGLIKEYNTTIAAYNDLVNFLIEQINAFEVKPEEIEWSQQVLLTTISGEVPIKFQQLSSKLNNIIKAAELQQQQAISGLHQARLLRLKIIAASMLMSVAIAAILAFYTSRAISQPLESVTKVAQQVTTESNFTLQAPVTTADEIGSLAISLNQLIQWISVYTQELKLAQTQLIQTEKMSSLGQMVAGIAHEINNPVNFIYGNLNHTQDYMQQLLELVELYQQEYPQPTLKIENKIAEIELDYLVEDLPKLLSSMKMGAERIRQIILSLRNFSRLDEAEMKAADLHEGIDNTLLILNNRIKHDIEIVKKYGDIPLVECYPALLNQVFMNILSNAIDAALLPKSQPLKQIVIRTYKLSSNQVQVAIWDNGAGIPPEVKAKIFDPFFTTKPIGQGTGLGLAVSYQIIEKHNGKITVNSEPERGTEFIVSLPIKSNI